MDLKICEINFTVEHPNGPPYEGWMLNDEGWKMNDVL